MLPPNGCLDLFVHLSPKASFCNNGFHYVITDFGPHNLLVDDLGNVKAVIDWHLAQTLSWETFCIFPALLTVIWPKRHKYSDWMWEILVGRQDYFLKVLREMEEAQDF
jgi:hypothetical protein